VSQFPGILEWEFPVALVYMGVAALSVTKSLSAPSGDRVMPHPYKGVIFFAIIHVDAACSVTTLVSSQCKLVMLLA